MNGSPYRTDAMALNRSSLPVKVGTPWIVFV